MDYIEMRDELLDNVVTPAQAEEIQAMDKKDIKEEFQYQQRQTWNAKYSRSGVLAATDFHDGSIILTKTIETVYSKTNIKTKTQYHVLCLDLSGNEIETEFLKKATMILGCAYNYTNKSQANSYYKQLIK